MNTRVTQRRSGFTLVELLVVIGIIALLISILLPALNRARAQANTTKCLANLRSIGQGLMVYTVQFKGSYPYGYWDGVGGTVNGIQEYPPLDDPNTSDWMTLLVGNSIGKSGGSKFGEVINVNNAAPQQLFACPAAIQTENKSIRTLHFTVHPRLMPDLDYYDRALPTTMALKDRLLKPYKVGKLKRSAEICLIFDGIQRMDTTGNADPVAYGLDADALASNPTSGGVSYHKAHYLLDDGSIDFYSQPVFAPNEDFYSPPYQGYRMSNLRWRHGRNNAANIVYADGHGETRNLKPGINAEVTARNLYVNPSR